MLASNFSLNIIFLNKFILINITRQKNIKITLLRLVKIFIIIILELVHCAKFWLYRKIFRQGFSFSLHILIYVYVK